MNSWYYLVGSEQVGPVSEADLLAAKANGTIHGDTLVWCEGMDDWKPLAETSLGQAPPQDQAASQEATAVAGDGAASPLPEAKKRPTSVTAFGILNIVFGCKTLICLPVSIPLMVIGFKAQPDLFSEWYMVAVMVLNPLAFFNGILELASGIGLLKCKLWARKTALLYAVFALMLGACGVLIEASFFISRIGQANEQVASALGGAIGGVIGGVIGLVYPVLLLVFMRKPAAVEACVE